MINQSLITILLPCYNCELTISKTIQSILSQSFRDYSCIILDNDSSDNTLSIVDKLVVEDERFKVLVNNKNMGIAFSFQKLVTIASTPFSIFLAADDYWHPDSLCLLLKALIDNPSAVCAVPKTIRFRRDGYSQDSNGTYPIAGDRSILRTIRYLSSFTDNSRFYGLYRTEALHACNVPLNFFAADFAFTALTFRYGSHLQVDGDGGTELLSRELPLTMRKYFGQDASIIYYLELLLFPFLRGYLAISTHFNLVDRIVLLPVCLKLNFSLGFSVMRSLLASVGFLRYLYFKIKS